MTSQLNYSGTLVVVTCWCGTRHAVPSELRNLQERQHRDGERMVDIFCPLGHCHAPAGKGEAQILRERLAAEERRSAATLARLDQERASHAATKGQLTKSRKRAAGGACPCCNRTFVQLARHMKTKHPDYGAEAGT